MRRFAFHLLVASFTFTAGVLGSYLAHGLLSRPPIVNGEVRMPVTFAPPAPVRTCEVHGTVLKEVSIQRVCGEYSGRFDGGWVKLEDGCTTHKKRRMSLEDAQFYLNMGGGARANTWMWWQEYEAARKAQFPHGYGWLAQDCESGEERCVTIYSCAECRAAEVQWKRDSLKRSGR